MNSIDAIYANVDSGMLMVLLMVMPVDATSHVLWCWSVSASIHESCVAFVGPSSERPSACLYGIFDGCLWFAFYATGIYNYCPSNLEPVHRVTAAQMCSESFLPSGSLYPSPFVLWFLWFCTILIVRVINRLFMRKFNCDCRISLNTTTTTITSDARLSFKRTNRFIFMAF